MKVITLIFLAASLTGCDFRDKFEDCIQKEQEEYRAKYPNASYSQLSHLRGSFEASCSNFRRAS